MVSAVSIVLRFDGLKLMQNAQFPEVHPKLSHRPSLYPLSPKGVNTSREKIYSPLGDGDKTDNLECMQFPAFSRPVIKKVWP